MEEKEIIEGTSNMHKSTACCDICLRIFKLPYTYEYDWTTDNELVSIQRTNGLCTALSGRHIAIALSGTRHFCID